MGKTEKEMTFTSENKAKEIAKDMSLSGAISDTFSVFKYTKRSRWCVNSGIEPYGKNYNRIATYKKGKQVTHD